MRPATGLEMADGLAIALAAWVVVFAAFAFAILHRDCVSRGGLLVIQPAGAMCLK